MSINTNGHLRDYILAKQSVSSLVRAARPFLQDQGERATQESYRALLSKLAEDRFNLAVVGQFKRGKSSLMNAIVGRDLLPTGLLPLTSVITSLCYGPAPRVTLRRKDWALEQTVSVSSLDQFVTERGNPGNEKGILEARVEYPLDFLRRGLYFVDTPGVGSANLENTATTYAFLPEVDAVIFVTSVEAPLSETEERFLRDIHQYVDKLFIVANKVDLLGPQERPEVLEYIRAGIQRALGTEQLRLFPVSALQALGAKLRSDIDALLNSGLQPLEDDLTSFLTEEKSRVFLISALDRFLRLLPVRQESPESPDTTEPASHADILLPDESARALQQLYNGALSLRAALQEGRLVTPQINYEPASVPAILERHKATQPARHSVQTRPSASQTICSICAGQSQALFDLFVQWQYRLSVQAEARLAFATSSGFCHLHTWLYQEIASPQGISEGYLQLVDRISFELRNWLEDQSKDGQLHTLLPGAGGCVACRVLQETAAALSQSLLAQLVTLEGRTQYVQTGGLCLPHLQYLLTLAPPRETAEFLVREQIRRLEELSEDLHSYVLKRDALKRELLHSNEENAWLRALTLLSGERVAQ